RRCRRFSLVAANVIKAFKFSFREAAGQLEILQQLYKGIELVDAVRHAWISEILADEPLEVNFRVASLRLFVKHNAQGLMSSAFDLAKPFLYVREGPRVCFKLRRSNIFFGFAVYTIADFG